MWPNWFSLHKAFSSLVSILFIWTGMCLHSLLLKKRNSYWRMQAIWTLELGRLTHPRMTIMETHGLPGEIKCHSQHDLENAEHHCLPACQLPIGRVRSCPNFTNQISHLICSREEWRKGHSDIRKGELFSTGEQTPKWGSCISLFYSTLYSLYILVQFI